MYRFSICVLIMMLSGVIGCQPPSSSPSPAERSQATQRPPNANVRPSRRNWNKNDMAPGIGMSKQAPIKSNVDQDVFDPQQDDREFDLSFLSWNVESDGADSNVIAEQLSELNVDDRYDVFGLTEVLPEDFGKFRNALGKHYKYAYSKSGRNDRLQILYNEDKFEKVRHFELEEINLKNRYRAPLVVHLKSLDGDYEFLVVVNHLARGKAEIRQQQATMLVEWARGQTLPIVAIGDYNFDYVFDTDKGNPGFVNFMRDNVWSWVKPEQMIDTNWYDDPEQPDGKDDYPGSMLDFAFVANGAKEWSQRCRVLVRDHDFPDDETTSDHRPFELLLSK
ncbi:MAG: endonuclease/exonuclease/phosphatase family protein [Planctomycetota bacterium]